MRVWKWRKHSRPAPGTCASVFAILARYERSQIRKRERIPKSGRRFRNETLCVFFFFAWLVSIRRDCGKVRCETCAKVVTGQYIDVTVNISHQTVFHPSYCAIYCQISKQELFNHRQTCYISITRILNDNWSIYWRSIRQISMVIAQYVALWKITRSCPYCSICTHNWVQTLFNILDIACEQYCSIYWPGHHRIGTKVRLLQCLQLTEKSYVAHLFRSYQYRSIFSSIKYRAGQDVKNTIIGKVLNSIDKQRAWVQALVMFSRSSASNSCEYCAIYWPCVWRVPDSYRNCSIFPVM